jgi:ribosomal protein L29
MSTIENLKKELSRLRQQINEKEHSEPELEALFKDTDNLIKQLTELRGKVFNKLFSLKTRDLRKTIVDDRE